MKEKLTLENFITLSRMMHGNKYDYSKINFEAKDEKGRVCIICPEHGEFWQSPYSHIKGHKCLKCSGKKKKTTEEFIKDSIKIHGDKYDYSKVEYINNDTKVCIVCPIHGEFWQTPNKHLNGRGCQKCGGTNRFTIDEFTQKSNEIHKFKYDYSKVEYVNNKTKVCIVCPIHGEFWQTPHAHIHGQGCPACGGTKKLTTKTFILRAREIHGWKYDYSKVEYIDSATKVCIICPDHGEFWQTPHDHLNGNGCPNCNKHVKSNNEKFIENAKLIHGDKYDYSRVKYVNSETKVCILCSDHGEFWQTPHNHLNGQGCPYCKTSKLENEINEFLLSKQIVFERQKTFDWLVNKGHLYLDYFLPDYHIAIECQGEQHFKPIEQFGGLTGFTERQKLDFLKYRLCEENGIKILYYGTKEYSYFQKIYTDKLQLLKLIYESRN